MVFIIADLLLLFSFIIVFCVTIKIVTFSFLSAYIFIFWLNSGGFEFILLLLQIYFPIFFSLFPISSIISKHMYKKRKFFLITNKKFFSNRITKLIKRILMDINFYMIEKFLPPSKTNIWWNNITNSQRNYLENIFNWDIIRGLLLDLSIQHKQNKYKTNHYIINFSDRKIQYDDYLKIKFRELKKFNKNLKWEDFLNENLCKLITH